MTRETSFGNSVRFSDFYGDTRVQMAGETPNPRSRGRVPSSIWIFWIAILGAIPLLLLWRAPEPTATASGPELSSGLAQIPNVKFTDITAESGIKFSHVNGASGEKLLPETMGGGVAFLDFDNDG
ncbi:MAG TPA: hypothetical protein VNT99_09000, partial [Methylomirabilota bacterium]|nr:hypothetical protein [Methylomirabilota bacterium]